jgi:hypothetical protein
MTERMITALFTDDARAHRAAEAVRALGFGEDRMALIARETLASGHFGPGGNASARAGDVHPSTRNAPPRGMVLVVRAGAEDEGKLVGVLEHHDPDRISSEGVERYSAGWTRFDEAAGSLGAVEITDDRLGTVPARPSAGTASGPTPTADTAPPPGSAGGGPQARLDRMRRSVLGTPDPALDRAPETAPNTPAGERREEGRQTRAERDTDRQNS